MTFLPRFASAAVSIVGPVAVLARLLGVASLVPLFYGILAPLRILAAGRFCAERSPPISVAFLGLLGNCYWIYQTMLYFGGLPPLFSAGILLLYSLVLGLYFAAFGLLLALTGKDISQPHYALLARALFWVALEFSASRFTKVPWDLLGYSQVDNFLLTSLAPFTGVYGITFVLIAGQLSHRLGFAGLPAQTAYALCILAHCCLCSA